MLFLNEPGSQFFPLHELYQYKDKNCTIRLDPVPRIACASVLACWCSQLRVIPHGYIKDITNTDMIFVTTKCLFKQRVRLSDYSWGRSLSINFGVTGYTFTSSSILKSLSSCFTVSFPEVCKCCPGRIVQPLRIPTDTSIDIIFNFLLPSSYHHFQVCVSAKLTR